MRLRDRLRGSFLFWIVIAFAVAVGVFFLTRPFSSHAAEAIAAALSGKSIDWATIVGAILASLSWLVVPLFIILALAISLDTIFYYVTYRKPYLLVLLGRQLPPDFKKTETDVEKIVLLQKAGARAVQTAQQLIRAPIGSWKDADSYKDALWRLLSTQLSLIQQTFVRSEDTVRAFLMLIEYADENDREGELLFFPIGAGKDKKKKLTLSMSIAGRTVLQTNGDAVSVANVENVFYDPDFRVLDPSEDYRSLLCVPILAYDGFEEKVRPMFVLTIDSTLEEAFAAPFVTAAMAFAASFGIVLQRWVELIGRDHDEKEKAAKKPQPPRK